MIQGRPLIRTISALLSLAVAAAVLAALPLTPPADAQGRSFYGIAMQAPEKGGHLTAEDYDRMGRGRVGTLRMPISWGWTEPAPGDYRRLYEIDSVIGPAAARGIRLLPFVFHPPDHVRTPPTGATDRDAFRRFMSVLAQRYGPGGTYWEGPYRQYHPGAKPLPVRTWQLFNEQNGRFFWGGKPSPRAYGQLVKAGADGIRGHDPRASITLGGMFATPRGWGSLTSWEYLNRLYRVKGIKRAFDAVAIHPYAPNLRGVRRQMQRVRNVMRRHNDAKAGMRVSEFGWGSQRAGHPLTKTPKEQASLLRKSFRMFARQRGRQNWNVKGISWFSWQDGDGCPFCQSSGLFSGPAYQREPKPAWHAFRRVTNNSDRWVVVR